MGVLRLRRFAATEQQRLGVLLTRVKDGVASETEEEELSRLLLQAKGVSDSNARTVANLRGVKLKSPPNQGKVHAKTS